MVREARPLQKPLVAAAFAPFAATLFTARDGHCGSCPPPFKTSSGIALEGEARAQQRTVEQMYHRGDAQRPHAGGDHHGSESHAAIWSGEGLVVEKPKIIAMTVQSMKAIIQVGTSLVTMHVDILPRCAHGGAEAGSSHANSFDFRGGSSGTEHRQGRSRRFCGTFCALARMSMCRWRCRGCADHPNCPLWFSWCSPSTTLSASLCSCGGTCLHFSRNSQFVSTDAAPSSHHSTFLDRVADAPMCCNDRRKCRQCSSCTESLTIRVAEAGSHDSNTRKIVGVPQVQFIDRVVNVPTVLQRQASTRKPEPPRPTHTLPPCRMSLPTNYCI